MSDVHSLEKGAAVCGTVYPTDPTAVPPPFDRAAERRLLRKLDLRVLPVLWFLYLVNFIDRANIGNAKIQGMEKELNLIGQRFNIAVWVFNLGYLVAGIPLQIAFKKYGPKSLCIMMFCWGITVVGCGLVKRWEQLVVCRVLMGCSESAFISGAAYLIGTYYTKKEYLTRYVFFCTAGIIAGAINGFLSTLIAKMSGTAGYSAWRWIFIIEGIISISVSIVSWPLIVPWPENVTFLPAEEKALLLARVKADGSHISDDEISVKKALYMLKDWKIWAGVLMNVGVTENANSLSNFQPTILKGLGYTAIQAQIHTIPVYLTGAAFSVIFAYMSERLCRQYYFYMLGWAVLATGLAVEIAYPASAAVRYMAVFFIASGCYLAMPISIVWISINAGSGYKRAVAIGAVINFGTAGAFVSSNVFLKSEEPRFRSGFSTSLGLACVGALAATITFFGCMAENKKRDMKRAELPDTIEQTLAELGDEHPDFRLVL
ncbi:MFS general substrate transporter [Dothidotthia symphoricarpi CBS 119687]|uniref:MFS general substrate transporter n=1 Tax=Dothidotthia symphoricarpi CBS 119687 TaxID=1392245 RepID=A0A6A6AIE6_9PLEO|nr:MFS general substrate transporter [Dothidotthia symphoricarpi CBS 119687]KAF2131729.1 MFS general substrate transporter [Dothidotthia symphoricarpi CBS 119687]